MEFQDITFSKEEGVAIITLNRPPVNAMRYQTYVELEKAAAFITADGEFRAVIITGGGERAFCGGADVRAFYELRGSVFNVREYNANAGSALRKIRELEVPVIGAAPYLGRLGSQVAGGAPSSQRRRTRIKFQAFSRGG